MLPFFRANATVWIESQCCDLLWIVERGFRMGFEPLPFDDRPPCFCHQNCPSFRKPEKRWWLVWSDPPAAIPELGEGILVEFDNLFVPAKFCTFLAVTLPPTLTLVSLTINPTNPQPGPLMRRQSRTISAFGTSINRLQVPGEECDIALNLPGFPPFDLFGGCNMFPVRWYENANDVPH